MVLSINTYLDLVMHDVFLDSIYVVLSISFFTLISGFYFHSLIIIFVVFKMVFRIQ